MTERFSHLLQQRRIDGIKQGLISTFRMRLAPALVLTAQLNRGLPGTIEAMVMMLLYSYLQKESTDSTVLGAQLCTLILE